MNVWKVGLTRMAGLLLILSCHQLQAEERNVRALMHWQGEGDVYAINTDQMLFQGVLKGVLYVETEKGDLDGAYAVCPVSQTVYPETGQSEASGHCEITVSAEDVVYATLACEGLVGDCKGETKLVDGHGRFEGVSGGGDLRIRSVVGALMKGIGSGGVVRSGEGIAMFPNLKVITPDNPQ